MTRYLLGIFLVFLLTTGCNSAFRANSTFIRVSPPVAKYLQHKEVVIHNNDSRKDIYRKVSIEVPRESDSLYRLKFKKIKGETIILEITDSFQIKIKGLSRYAVNHNISRYGIWLGFR
ncbi:MAG: hypothetical protein RIS28_1539 [Bacteroidota bacterium]